MNSIYLHGSDDVSRASVNITSAAQQMSQAASQIEESLRAHERFLGEWLEQFKHALAQWEKERK